MGENRIIARAFVVSIVLHLLLAVLTWKLPFIPEIDPALASDDFTEVEMVFVEPEEDPAADAAEQDMPTAFTSIPDRLAAEQPPERADFLADNNALAADQTQGDSQQPRAEEDGPFPQVEIQQEDLDGAGGVEYSQAPLPDPRAAVGSQAEGAEGADETKQDADRQQGQGQWALPAEKTEAGGETVGEEDDSRTDDQEQPELEDWWGGTAPSVLKEGDQSNAGDRGFEFDQKSMGELGAGVSIVDDFSLNTYAWNFAPWIKHFANQLHRHWMAPYAYRLGVISGMTKIRIVVEKDGRLSAMEVLDTVGHESLHEASQAALKAFAPYAALPPDFPEPNLVIILSLHYPAWRR